MFPKVITIGSFYIPAYGLFVAAGFFAALWLTGRLARRLGLNSDAVTNLGVYAALVGLVGAKLLMLVYDFEYYRSRPGEVFSFATLQAGGVFYGGLVVALGFSLFYMRRHKLPAALTLDAFAPGLALAQGIGRMGCFAAGCCWGVECDRAWAVKFTSPDASDLTGVPLDVWLHPSQLYEAALSFVVAAVVWMLFQKRRGPGTVIGAYLVLSAAARFAVEFVRYHEQPNPFGGSLSAAQWTSVGLASAGLFVLARAGLRGREAHGGRVP